MRRVPYAPVDIVLSLSRMATAMIQGHRTRLDMIESWADHDADTFHSFAATAKRFGVDLQSADVLDVGCGANAPMTAMLHASGVRVTGVDHYLGYRWGLGFKPARYWQYLREAGPLKTARKILGECVYDRTYFTRLSEVVGRPLTERGLDLRAMDIATLGFSDSSFDLVHSNATWEHLPDVRRANEEVARVLRPGGLAYIEIHLFPSISGGHDLPWIVPGRIELQGRIPWRHLRDPEWQAPVYLNRLRERDYLGHFTQTPSLEVIDWITEFVEGEEFVTEEIRQELDDYSVAELTRRSVIAVLRKTGRA
jgi:SAM-dependent methyltransferase